MKIYKSFNDVEWRQLEKHEEFMVGDKGYIYLFSDENYKTNSTCLAGSPPFKGSKEEHDILQMLYNAQ